MKVIRSAYPNQPIRVGIHEFRRIRVIVLHEIMYCEANRNYTFVHLADGTKCVTCRNLAIIRALLEPEGFVSIHKSYLVNSAYIKMLTTEHDAMVVLTNNKKLKIARRMKSVLLKSFFS